MRRVNSVARCSAVLRGAIRRLLRPAPAGLGSQQLHCSGWAGTWRRWRARPDGFSLTPAPRPGQNAVLPDHHVGGDGGLPRRLQHTEGRMESEDEPCLRGEAESELEAAVAPDLPALTPGAQICGISYVQCFTFTSTSHELH